jgi:hypothetical protein
LDGRISLTEGLELRMVADAARSSCATNAGGASRWLQCQSRMPLDPWVRARGQFKARFDSAP